MALWGEFEKRLATELQVVAFDPLGVGRSTDVPWLYSTRAMARDAVAVLDHLGIGRADVFGLSLGGMVASWVAVDFPTRTRRLVLASTIPEPAAVSRRGLGQAMALARCLVRPGLSAEIALVHRILSPRFRSAHPDRVLAIERSIRGVPAKRRNLAILALAAARHSGRLERLPKGLEVLLLFGELDLLAGDEARAELSHDLPSAELEIVRDAGHDISLEQPRDAADRVVSFLLGERPLARQPTSAASPSTASSQS
jgi:pimeloyl-ACP methyl ester carboxylesterase